MKTKPNFIVAGSAKAGTTSLYHYLAQHPDVYLPQVKEPHFFTRDHNFNFPIIKSEQDYLELFADAGQKQAIGEASTAYLYFPGTAEKIKASLPTAKIVIMLRSPVDVAFSMWGHQVREGIETLSFVDAIDQELLQGTRLIDGVEYGFNYIRQGLVSAQVAEYQTLFGPENVFLGDFTELKTDPEALMKRLFGFLGLNTSHQLDLGRQFNPSGTPRFSVLHSLLNSQNFFRRLAVAPLKLFLSDEQRHALWNRLRDRNIIAGQRHAMDSKTHAKLQKLFAEETAAINVLLHDHSLSS